ncbi:class D sortase [Minwuia sp.]|uniref:class D sortase n=1 Tax=Minwuia sp. TaxID=2493630 RepID=UPI003A8EDAAD
MTRRNRSRWPLRSALVAAALGGAIIAGDGVFMVAKAELGQVLLDRAYADGLSEPWPGADVRPVARLRVPSLERTVVVLDSASGKAMAWGPGHVAGSTLPGNPGLSAIGGHRDSHLAFLGELGPGTEVIVERPAHPDRSYRITHAEVVDSRIWRYPLDPGGPPRLALTTCWPLDAQAQGPMRLVVYAEASTG